MRTAVRSRPSPDAHGWRDAHARAKQVIWILPGLQVDLHGNALHDLHEVAGRVLRRQQAELGARGRGDAVDVPLELAAAERVDFDDGLLPRLHRLELRLLEVRGDPDAIQIDDRHERLPGLHDLPGLDGLAANHAVAWSG